MSTSFDTLNWDELMDFEAKQSTPLSLEDEDIQRFNLRTLLYKADQQGYRLLLMPPDPGSGLGFLTPLLQDMTTQGYLEITANDYAITPKGRAELEAMAEQYHSLVRHYDIFAHVDLDSSSFLEPGDDPKEQILLAGEYYPRFLDLRVAVMRFKGVSPFDMVFLNLLREGRIGQSENWEFDLALGRELYKEVEEIVNTAYTVSDLTALKKTNDNGEIPGSDILRDVIVAGNQINQERELAKQTQPRYETPQQVSHVVHPGHEIDVEIIEQRPLFNDYHYNSHAYYEHYRDPFYVEPAWKRHRYRRWFDD
ncbi:MAG: hypothetical protein ACO1RX_05935 [Candidatus Sericytochromatia bacterium]